MPDEGSNRTLAAIPMAKSIKYSLAIWLTTFCLCLLSLLTITKNAFPQDRTEIRTLIKRLESKSSIDRKRAAEELGKIGGRNAYRAGMAYDARQALTVALQRDWERDVRRAAAKALANFGIAGARVLIEALGDDSRTNEAASHGLEEVRDKIKAATPKMSKGGVSLLIKDLNLTEALKDWDKTVRLFAVKLLAEIGPKAEAAVPDLIVALRDDEQDVRQAAAYALGEIGPGAKAAVRSLIEAHSESPFEDVVNSAIYKALGKIGPAAKPALIEALKDKDVYVRKRAARALGKIGPPAEALVPALIEALKDKDVYVRNDAARALGEIGPEAKAAVPALIEALKDRSFIFPDLPARALGKIGPAAIPPLIKLLKEEYESNRYDVRPFVRLALVKIGPAAIQALVDALKDKGKDMPWYVVRALGDIGPEAKAAVPALIEALKDENEEVRRNAAEALRIINTPEAEKALEEYKQ